MLPTRTPIRLSTRKKKNQVRPPRGVETTPSFPGNKALSEEGGAESGAVAAPGAEIPPDLAMVVSAWPHLTEEERKAVLAIIRAAGQDRVGDA